MNHVILVSLLYCIYVLYIFILFYVIALRSCFPNTSSLVTHLYRFDATNLMLEKQDHRAITINKLQILNTKTHYKRDTNITWFTQDGLRPHRNCQFLFVKNLPFFIPHSNRLFCLFPNDKYRSFWYK